MFGIPNDTYELEATYLPVMEIREAVGKLQWIQPAMNEPIMVVIGMEEYGQLSRLGQQVLWMRLEYKAKYGPNTFVFSIPVVLSRRHSGIVVLPDMTGSCSFVLTDEGSQVQPDFYADRYRPRWKP
jgi:hypothetical protein